MQPHLSIPNRARDGASVILDRVVLFCTTALVPRLDHYDLGAFSLAWLYFAGLAIYVLLRRPRLKFLRQPVVPAAGVFIAYCALYEFLEPFTRLEDIFRFAQSIAGGLLIATLCTDRTAMKYALLGLLAGSLWLSMDVYRASYHTLSVANPVTFAQASQLRAETMGSLGIAANLNRVGFLCAEGAVVAFSFAFFAVTAVSRVVFTGLGVPCLLGTLLVQSRSATLIVLVTGAFLVATCRGRRLWVLSAVIILFCVFWIITPAAAFGRFAVAATRPTGEINDARVRVYEAALRTMPQYALTGVGAGRFFSYWAVENGMEIEGRVLGAHNAYLQILINWGLAGLALFLVFLWSVYRCLPTRCWTEGYSFTLLGLAIAMAIRLAFEHDFYVKDLGLLVGLLVAGKTWIWARPRIIFQVGLPESGQHLPSLGNRGLTSRSLRGRRPSQPLQAPQSVELARRRRFIQGGALQPCPKRADESLVERKPQGGPTTRRSLGGSSMNPYAPTSQLRPCEREIPSLSVSKTESGIPAFTAGLLVRSWNAAWLAFTKPAETKFVRFLEQMASPPVSWI